MTLDDLEQSRRARWHTGGTPLGTLEAARDFVADCGLVLLYPVRPPVPLPTFMGAWLGEERNAPTQKLAFGDAGAGEAEQIVDRLAARRDLYQSNLFPDNRLLISPEVFPYLYSLVVERNPGADAALSRLSQQTMAALEKSGPLGVEGLRERLGTEITGSAVERALNELWIRLRVLPVGTVDGGTSNGPHLWHATARWAPEAVREAADISQPAALSALISRYLHTAVAAEQPQIEELFSHLAPRSRIREALNALLAAREFTFLNIGHKSLVQLRPEPQPRPALRPVPRPAPRPPKPLPAPPQAGPIAARRPPGSAPRTGSRPAYSGRTARSARSERPSRSDRPSFSNRKNDKTRPSPGPRRSTSRPSPRKRDDR